MVGIRSNHERCWPCDGGGRGRTGSLDLPRPPFGWFDLKLCVSYVSEHLSDLSGPNATRGEGRRSSPLGSSAKRKWPLAGPFLCRASVVMMTMLDDHHPVRVAMAPPALMPAVIAMFAELGMRAVAVVVAAALDHDGLGVGNRRCRNRDRAKRRDDQSKLLHAFLL